MFAAPAAAQIGTGIYTGVGTYVSKLYGNSWLGGTIHASAGLTGFQSRISSNLDYSRATFATDAHINLCEHSLEGGSVSSVGNVAGTGAGIARIRVDLLGVNLRDLQASSGTLQWDVNRLVSAPVVRQDVALIGPLHIEIRGHAGLGVDVDTTAGVDLAARAATMSGRARTWANASLSFSLSIYVADAGIEATARFADHDFVAHGTALLNAVSGSAARTMSSIDLRLRAYARVRKFWTWTPWEWATASHTLAHYTYGVESETLFDR